VADSKVKRESYITIQGWMLTDLKLKGNELQTYAILYGFSQADGQYFEGSLQYVADWINGTRRTALNCLKSLAEKGFITKNESIINGVKFCKYQCVPLEALGVEMLSGVVKNFHQGGEKSSPGVVKNFHQGGEKSSPNIIDNNIDSKYREKIDKPGAPAPIPSHPPDGKAPGKKPGIDTEAIFRRYTQDEKVLSLLRDWLKVRKAKRAPETEKALTLNLDKLATLARNSSTSQAEYLEAVIARGWAAFYPLNNWGKPVPVRHTVKTEADHAAGGHASGFGW
jgi:hypothetical protein